MIPYPQQFNVMSDSTPRNETHPKLENFNSIDFSTFHIFPSNIFQAPRANDRICQRWFTT